jgi:hypothetical protein
MPHSEVRVGPVLASTIYLFDHRCRDQRGEEEFTLTQLRGAPPRFGNVAQETASTKTSRLDSQISAGDSHHDTALPRRKSDAGRFVRAFVCLIIAFPASCTSSKHLRTSHRR